MILTLAILAALIIGGLCGYLIFRYVIKFKYNEMLANAEKASEVIKEKKLLEVKEKFINKKAELEQEIQQRNQKMQQTENQLKQREMNLNQRQEETNKHKQELSQLQSRLDTQRNALTVKEQELESMIHKEREKLEQLSGLSAEEAKNHLIESMKDEARTNAQSYINEIMDEAKINANNEARKIVIKTIQRVATEAAVENSVSVFHIENDDVKGRIIGREGRNIRALEAACGVEIVVDDTPEAIVISAFDPIRRETCRLSLHQLVADGRIHPARIKEVVAKVKKQLEQEVIETGKRTAIDLGIHGLHPELVRIIGKMKYRSSYGQNLLQHARETANLCAVMAAELGLMPRRQNVPDSYTILVRCLMRTSKCHTLSMVQRLLHSIRRSQKYAMPSVLTMMKWRWNLSLLRLYRYVMPSVVQDLVHAVRLLRHTSSVSMTLRLLQCLTLVFRRLMLFRQDANYVSSLVQTRLPMLK